MHPDLQPHLFELPRLGLRAWNYSSFPTAQLINWLPANAREPGAVEEVVFLPDVCPGKSPLPAGCVVRTRASHWRQWAISDCGCGMRLLATNLSGFEFLEEGSSLRQAWESVGKVLRRNRERGEIGDLGGGNHFLDALLDEEGKLLFLIHTGSRQESGLVDNYVDSPGQFEDVYAQVSDWAGRNRATIGEVVADYFDGVRMVIDLPHNTISTSEREDGSVIIRKGAVRTVPGDLNIIPSSMTGDVALVRAKPTVSEGSLDSLSHGTGRAVSRSEAKAQFRDFDYAAMRANLFIPDYISNESLNTEIPGCYRALDDALDLLEPLITAERRLTPVAYLGHL